jgi:hypothetical protein
MNVPSGDILVGDVLLNIFENLEGADLINCEDVCHRWRNVLKSESCWRGLFQRQTSLLWRRIESKLVEKKPGHYRNVCRAIVQYLQEVNCNLRAGNIKKTVHLIKFPTDFFDYYMEKYVGMADDYFAFKISNSGERFRWADQIVIADKSSMQITRTIALGCFNGASIVHFDNNVIPFVLFAFNKAVRIIDTKTLRTVCELHKQQRDWGIVACAYGHGLLAIYTLQIESGSGIHYLQVWDVQHAKPKLLKSVEIDYRGIRTGDNECMAINVHLKVEPSYIVVCAAWANIYDDENPVTTVHLISLKTFQIERSLSVMNRRVEYDQGLLLIGSRNERIRIIDAATGTYLHEIPTNHRFGRWIIDTRMWRVKMNSMYMIVLSECESEQTTLSVYDLSAIKNPKTQPDRLLLSTFNVDIAADGLIMDETHILAVSRKKQVVVIDFGSFDRFECLKSLLTES